MLCTTTSSAFSEKCRLLPAEWESVRVCVTGDVDQSASAMSSRDVTIHKWTLASLIWLLGYYILATFKVISGWVPTCDSAHSWWLYSVMISYSQSHYSNTQLISPCAILIMSRARLGNDKYELYKYLVWFEREPNYNTYVGRINVTLCAKIKAGDRGGEPS